MRVCIDPLNSQIAVAKRRVRETISKGKERFDSAAFVSAITNKNSLVVNHAIGSRWRVIAIVRRIIRPAAVEGDRQASGRIRVSENNVRECRASLLTRVPRFDQRWNTIDPAAHINAAA